jgi:hypothetical protein
VQGAHEEGVAALAQGMVADQVAKLPQNVGVPPAPELCLQPAFRDQQAQIFQAARDRLHAGLAVQIGESRAGHRSTAAASVAAACSKSPRSSSRLPSCARRSKT